MIQKFIKDIDALELDTDLQNYAKGNHSQAETVDYLTEKLGSLLLQDILEAEKKRANQQRDFRINTRNNKTAMTFGGNRDMIHIEL